MEQFLMLDKGQRIPLKLSFHLLSCSQCRKEVKMLTRAEKLMKAPLEFKLPITEDSVPRAMEQIDPSYNHRMKPVTFFQWIFFGIMMIGALITFGIMAMPYLQHKIHTALYFIFTAVLLIGYCAFFIFINLDFFIKKSDAKLKENLPNKK